MSQRVQQDEVASRTGAVSPRSEGPVECLACLSPTQASWELVSPIIQALTQLCQAFAGLQELGGTYTVILYEQRQAQMVLHILGLSL